jgi:hypothetical protein
MTEATFRRWAVTLLILTAAAVTASAAIAVYMLTSEPRPAVPTIVVVES